MATGALVPYSDTSDDDSTENGNASMSKTTFVECEELDTQLNNTFRKRKTGNKENWVKIKNKRLRMEGKEYLGFTKSENNKITQNCVRSAKFMKAPCTSESCKNSRKRRCIEISERSRQLIFQKFWNEMDWKQRKVFVASHVNKKPTAIKRTSSDKSRRQNTFSYFLHNGEDRIQVCRSMFINTLNIGYKTIQDWVNKSRTIGASTTNRRRGISRMKEEYKNLKEFFDSLPKLPAHYCRRDSMKLYLENMFKSISELYGVYRDFCKNKNVSFLSRSIFSRQFHQNNLSLFQQKKDQCNTCFSYKYGNVSEEKYRHHIANKEKARREKDLNKESAKKHECLMYCMDLQAVKLCPFLPAGKIYYKTKLCCHNFTIFNMKTKDAVCYWFSEDQNNQLNASTFTSCIIDFLTEYCITETKLDVILVSDGCGYQNRNNILSNALLNFSILHGVTIYQKYLEPGHTQMECDSVHSLIERRLRNREIHLPSDYATVTKEARKNPNPYKVKVLDYTFFKDYSSSTNLRYPSIRPGHKIHDLVITDIKCIKYMPNGFIQVKVDYDEEFVDLPRRPKKIDPILEYPSLLNSLPKIKNEKWKHLQELKEVLPKDKHAFYDNLLHT